MSADETASDWKKDEVEDMYSCVDVAFVVAFVVAVEAVSMVSFLCASPSLASFVAAVGDEMSSIHYVQYYV